MVMHSQEVECDKLSTDLYKPIVGSVSGFAKLEVVTCEPVEAAPFWPPLTLLSDNEF
jgi:hypothetical protein